MVSKAVVIALVAIVACPILLGYGLNLQPTTHTDYAPSNDPVDVTNFLLNSTYHGAAFADVYKLNTLATAT